METKFAEVNGKLEEVVVMTREEYEFDKNMMKLVGKADLIDEIEDELEKEEKSRYAQQVYLRKLRGEIRIAVVEVQEATGDTALKNAVDNLLDQLYRVGLADK